MMADELLNAQDLITAKKHDTFHSEVITGKAGGVSTGANIDYATNAVTGQVQKTLPATVNGIDWSYIGKFADGVTFTKKTDFAIDASGTQWIYTGSFPFTATAGTVPSEPTYQVVHVKSASAISNANGGSVQDFIDDLESPTGSSKIGYLPSGFGAQSTDVESVLRRSVNVEDYFIAAESDYTGMLLRAIATGASEIHLQDKEYFISEPLYLDGNQALIGKGSTATKITKTKKTVGAGSNKARSGSVTDLYNKNAILICRHIDNGYNYNTSLKGLTLKSDGYIVEYGIYAPRMSQLFMSDVQVFQCRYGFVTHDSWLTKLEKVICNSNTIRFGGDNYGWASGSRGFWWADDGSGLATGTSLSADNCWARDCHTGWDLFGLKYSSLDGCASDNISSGAYRFNLCEIAMNGCGHENVQIASQGAIVCLSSKVSMDSCSNFKVYGATSGTTAWLYADGGSITMDTSTFGNFITAGTSYNMIVQGGAKVTLNGVTVPTNGNSFIGYGGGSQIVNLTTVPPTITTAEGVRYLKGRARDNQVIEKTSKSVSSGGSTIATLTCNGGSGIESAVVRFKISWYDNTFPNGVGLSNVEVVCYQDGGTNYRQAINTSVNIGAGNGYTTAPTYSISRSGNVWSVIMTPAHGDVICNTITADVEVITGFNVALS